MKLQLLLASMTALTTACRPSADATPPAPQTDYTEAKVVTNFAYGPDTLQRMDLYLPAGRSPQATPTLVLLHGGGWNSGSKSDFVSYIDSFQRRMPEWAIINVDYRLVRTGREWPAPIDDVKSAVDLIASRSREWGIRADKLVLLGVSAGGHLALLQAYQQATPKIAAVVDFFGPTDLTAMYQRPWHPYVPVALQMVTGTNPALQPDKFRQWSPVTWISPQSPPTILLHGTADPVVDVSQSRRLKEELDGAGVKNELVIYPGLRHGWQGPDLQRSFDRIGAFLRANVY